MATVLKSNLRNLIINGGMDFFQRTTSSASITVGSIQSADRFALYTTSVGSPVGNIFRTTDSPVPEIKYSPTFSLTTTGEDLGGECHRMLHKIESIFSRDIANKKATYSMYYKTADFTDIKIQMNTPTAEDNFGSTAEFYTATVHPIINDNQWHRLVITVDVPADAVNGIYILNWTMNPTTTGATAFKCTGFMLHEGDVVQDFQRAGRDYTEELSLCQRYFEKSSPVDEALSSNAGRYLNVSRPDGVISKSQRFAVEKRATPVLNTHGGTTVGVSHTNVQKTGFDLSGSIAGNSSFVYIWSADSEL